jgi:CelD/BcsL family acetyltransferase involved in cellulose biosynthesis
MQIQIIQTLDEFDRLASEWNDLLEHSASHVPFLRHEYLATWWRTLGGGEWTSASLYIVLGRHPDGRLAGIAPLFSSLNRENEPALLLLGSIEISDYLDLIARPDDLYGFITALLDHLSSVQEPAWQVLDLYNILEASPTLSALEAVSQQRGWRFDQKRLQHCPYIPLTGDWETYLAGIDKKQRHEIRRKMRRTEENETPVRWYIVEDEARLDQEIEDFLALMAQDPEKHAFLTQAMRDQMHASVHAAFQAGWLQLAFLEVAGQKAAGYLNFDYGGHIWVYNSGINFSYRELSPGWVLLGYLLKWANENQRRHFDFMRGDEEYKYRFGGIDRFVTRLRLQRP